MTVLIQFTNILLPINLQLIYVVDNIIFSGKRKDQNKCKIQKLLKLILPLQKV